MPCIPFFSFSSTLFGNFIISVFTTRLSMWSSLLWGHQICSRQLCCITCQQRRQQQQRPVRPAACNGPMLKGNSLKVLSFLCMMVRDAGSMKLPSNTFLAARVVIVEFGKPRTMIARFSCPTWHRTLVILLHKFSSCPSRVVRSKFLTSRNDQQ